MAHLRHGLVVQEVGNDGFIHARAAEQGVQVYGRVILGHLDHKLVAGVRHLVHFCPGILRGPLVPLYVNQVLGHLCIAHVHLHLAVRDDTAAVDVVQAGDDRGTELVVFSEVQALDVAHGRRNHFLRILVVRDDTGAVLVPFLLDLLFCLEDGEIELGDQGFVGPGRSFFVVIIEFRGPWHQKHKDCENKDQRIIPPLQLRRRYLHNGRFLR